jgi:hypothetical protein
MNLAHAARNWAREVLDVWNRFWFEPADPATLGLIRICTGAMLFYTHAVWGLDLMAFFGPNGWLSRQAVELIQKDTYSYSYLWWLQDWPAGLWTAHAVALAAFALLTVGLFSRVAAVVSLIAALAYVTRAPGALFGLDQINVMLCTYLAVGPCGDAFSLDRWRASRRNNTPLPVRKSWTANLSIRLIQIHMCIIYLFAGMAKLTGQAWWDGTAMWMAFGNLEYQSLDMTWMSEWPRMMNLMVHVTIAWELSYMFLVWPRLTRPVVVLLAVPLHMGIAICLGMITFGLLMLVGNMAFVPPEMIRALLPARAVRLGRAGGASGEEARTKPLRGGRSASSPAAAKR